MLVSVTPLTESLLYKGLGLVLNSVPAKVKVVP
jgi:hypothetical protein